MMIRYTNHIQIRHLTMRYLKIIVVFLTFHLACSDNPTEPEIPGSYGYNVYYWLNTTNPQLCMYNTKTFEIDSISVPFDASIGLSISGDGLFLYFASDMQVTVVNTSDYTEVTHFPVTNIAPVETSPDGKWFAVLGDSISIFSCSTNELVYSEPTRCIDGQFSPNSEYFVAYAIKDSLNNDYSHFSLIDLSKTPPDSEWRDAAGNPYQVSISSDNNRLYYFSNFYNFTEYDFMADTIINTISLLNGLGRNIVKNNAPEIYINAPGSFLIHGDAEIYKLNAIDYSIDTFRTDTFLSAIDSNSFIPDDMVLTPDEKYLILTNPQVPHMLLQFDTENNEFVHFIGYIGGVTSTLAIQKQL